MSQVAVALVLVVLLYPALLGCDRRSSAPLQGQTNTHLTFFGKVVDQEGRPLAGATFQFRIEAYPKDWTFETRGRDNDVTGVTSVSDIHGNFAIDVTGCRLIRLNASLVGYRHFFDKDPSDDAVQTHVFGLISWGEVQYKSDPERPAVFVFIKDGAKEISVLPSRGGFYAYGKRWIANKPAWPKNPSLKDVVQKQPATKP